MNLSILLVTSLLRAKNGFLSGSLPSAVEWTHPPPLEPPPVWTMKAPFFLRWRAILLKSGCLTEHIGWLGYIRQKFTVPTIH